MPYWIYSPAAWMSLVTLTVLEIVLGVDNIIFISILSNKLPTKQQKPARQWGLMLALISRIALLVTINWVKSATKPVLTLPFTILSMESREVSFRDLILFFGGLFLIYKSVKEIHEKVEGGDHGERKISAPSLGAVLIQIMILDIVFSLDSVITAVGMADHLELMIAAVVLAVGFMLFAAGAIAGFVERHPTIKILALAFLVLIGVNLMVDAAGHEIDKGYTYFAMAFAVAVEAVNLKIRKQDTRTS